VNYDESEPNSQFVSQKLYYIKTIKNKKLRNPTGSIHIKLRNPTGSIHIKLRNPTGSIHIKLRNPTGSIHIKLRNPTRSIHIKYLYIKKLYEIIHNSWSLVCCTLCSRSSGRQ